MIDIDDEALAPAADELGTTSKVTTVNAALPRVAEQGASRRMPADMMSMELDLDPDTMKGAWR
ncbi:hypothetical protein Aple_048870 [Acrocarpospora pleiomorpha]|uniref:Uncharacterized protein n=1 Tax=Acrocarpospora pleiomorpha TaxID=90975 RepID=A0A5M3XM10_9ACTN|nr:hypothetical protein [Acrocarpospora pleiomorpha]GES21990.1 hypothetical protein Aple_048870 [Acrocarpospora pleiomorpha]